MCSRMSKPEPCAQAGAGGVCDPKGMWGPHSEQAGEVLFIPPCLWTVALWRVISHCNF